MFAAPSLVYGLVLGLAGSPQHSIRPIESLARIRPDPPHHERQLAVGADSTNVLIPHVRSEDRTISSLIEGCAKHSATLKTLLQDINRTNGLVYIERGTCRHGLHACLLMSVTLAGPNRILHVRLDTRGDPSAVSGLLAHELQHAAEALSEAGVTSNALLEAFFERLTGGPAARGQLEFETDAAVNVGEAVRREIRAYWQARHVRSDEAQIVALVAEGEGRSESFQHLLEALDASDVVVYLVPKLAHKGLGGYMPHSITATGGRRYIRAAVEIQGSDDRLIALLAHELQHAVEIAEASEVRDQETLQRFFQRANGTLPCAGESECYETQAAEDVERTVLGQLKTATSGAGVSARVGAQSQRSLYGLFGEMAGESLRRLRSILTPTQANRGRLDRLMRHRDRPDPR